MYRLLARVAAPALVILYLVICSNDKAPAAEVLDDIVNGLTQYWGQVFSNSPNSSRLIHQAPVASDAIRRMLTGPNANPALKQAVRERYATWSKHWAIEARSWPEHCVREAPGDLCTADDTAAPPSSR